ncbi:MAG: CD1247 N-terminal domain-containing protein [Huintestinicola sp.]
MTLSEKTAYLKGLMDGLNNEDKVTALIAEILTDMASEIEDMQDEVEELSEVIDTIDEDLGEMEKDYYGIDDDEDCCCGHHHYDDDDEDDDDFDEDFDDEDLYEVTCPSCNDTICLNESMLEDGSISCPNCGELLEFDLDDDSEDAE